MADSPGAPVVGPTINPEKLAEVNERYVMVCNLGKSEFVAEYGAAENPQDNPYTIPSKHYITVPAKVAKHFVGNWDAPDETAVAHQYQRLMMRLGTSWADLVVLEEDSNNIPNPVREYPVTFHKWAPAPVLKIEGLKKAWDPMKLELDEPKDEVVEGKAELSDKPAPPKRGPSPHQKPRKIPKSPNVDPGGSEPAKVEE